MDIAGIGGKDASGWPDCIGGGVRLLNGGVITTLMLSYNEDVLAG